MNKLTAWLREEIKEEFERQGEHGLIVWYDPGGTLESVVQEALPEGTRFLRFEGSYLALRFTLEGEDPDFQKRWVVYVPEDPPEESWLRDWELLGERLEMDLLGLLQRRYSLGLTPRLVELLRDRPGNARDLASQWNRVMDDRDVTEQALIESLLALGFGLVHWDIHEALLKFVAGDGWREKLEGRGLWKEWQEKVKDWTGWSDLPADEAALRGQLEASILLSELVEAVPELASRWTLVPSEGDRREEMASLARKWRERDPLRDAYCRSALKVEREYGLSGLLPVSEGLLQVETFRAVDEIWQQELRSAISPDGSNFGQKAQRLGEICRARKGLFWARREEGIGKFWKALDLSVRLYRGSREATEAVRKLSTVEDFVKRYTADEGWWQLDLWALETSALAQYLSAEDRRRFLLPAWTAYGDYLDRVNRAFAEVVKRQGWQPTQQTLWQEVTGRKRTAVFLVDALRFDLAQYLKQMVASEVGFEVKPIMTVLPSITELGMAALLPGGGEEGLSVAVEGERLAVRIGDVSVSSSTERKAYLEHQLGKQGKVVALEELEREDLGQVQLLVVFCRQIDEFGSFVADLHPQGLLDMTEQIARSVRYVANKGFERIYVAADHGFLFVPPEVRPSVSSPQEAAILKRRFGLGCQHEGSFNARMEDLGLKGSVPLSFPPGLTVFGLQGGIPSFLHGGLSLQECVIAFLKGIPSARPNKVEVKMLLPESITSRVVLVRLRAEASSILDRPRKVQVTVGEKTSEVCEMSPRSAQAEVSFTWLDFDAEPPPQVVVKLLDADTGEVLQEQWLKVKIIV